MSSLCRLALPNHSVSTGPPTVPRCSATPLGPPLGFLSRRGFGSGVSRDSNPGFDVRPHQASVVDQRVDLGAREVRLIAMVEPDHRRVLARAQALDLLVGEESVLRDLARLANADGDLQAVDDVLGAAQHAAEVRADVEPVLADGIEVEERVEGGHAFDVPGIELQRDRDLAHRLGRQVAQLLLGEVERGHHRRAWLRILRRQRPDLFQQVTGQGAHRSTSPSTVSAVPMIAIMSATMWLSAMRSRACRLTKDAERNFTRRGLWVPSLTM